MLLSPKGLIVQMHIASGVIYIRVDLHLDKLVGWVHTWTNWLGGSTPGQTGWVGPHLEKLVGWVHTWTNWLGGSTPGQTGWVGLHLDKLVGYFKTHRLHS